MKIFDMRKYDDYPKALRKHKYPFILVMLSLSIISFAVFYVGINLQSILLAFRVHVKENPMDLGHYEWTLQQFSNVWTSLTNPTSSDKLLIALKNTLFLFFMGNMVALPMGCFISYYLWKKMLGSSVYRVLFYLPHIISSVVMVIIYQNFVDPSGVISTIVFRLTGSPMKPYLQTYGTSIWMVWIYNTWIGFSGEYLLLTASMSRIPQEITESAQLDGITPLREFCNICVPLIWPTLQIILLQKVAGLLSADGPILLLTNGEYNTYTLGFWSYMQVYGQGSGENTMCFSAAVGLCMTAVVAPLALFTKYLTGKVNNDVSY